ncbi:mitochondrial large ribosomal subunit assembly [Desmophyllum pertusum]|uniref:RNA helicase n=1 Tax=Desmophyllum pertusum TaxID=174260 RepID=A0A9X0D7A2_9CNID|nr:mitochondrial large ribosomal subunit assembly [Desmophyllum pertusum]
MAAHSRGFQRPRGNFGPRFSSFQARPRPPMIRPPSLMSCPSPRVPFSSQDFVIGGGPIQQNKPPSKAPGPSSQTQGSTRHFTGCEAAQRFPNAKERLHNILQGALKGNGLTFDGRQVEVNFWQTKLHIPWPRPMSFYGEGSTKREAERNVAALACIELEKRGVANIGAATILKKEALENKDEPKWIYIDEDRLSKVESFLLKNSVLSQQLYGPQNQQHTFQRQPNVQAPKPTQSSAIKETLTGSSTSSQSQTQPSTQQDDNTHTAAVKTQEFWQDTEIVKDEDFSRWEITHAANTASNKEPPQDNADNSSSANSTAAPCKVKDIFSGSPWKPLSAEEHKKLDGKLLQEFSQRQDMLESRLSWFNEETTKLPVANHKQKIVELIEANKVVVLSGETGCGKTTQIPQYILDHAIQNGKGSTCNIVVTQPRRIVAMSIAERVASERGEMLGKSVGYQVRLEGVPPSQLGRILFCTTGILLRRMQNNALLQGVSHVIVDEVHERDINTDFLLILLRELLDKNQALKIVVMSATVNSERFSQYFHGCPSLSIPGFTHTVTEYFLSDIHELLGRALSKPGHPHPGHPPQHPGHTNPHPGHPHQHPGHRPPHPGHRPPHPGHPHPGHPHQHPGHRPPHPGHPHPHPGHPQGKRFKPNNSFTKVNSDQDSPEADAELITETILCVCRNYPEGAILCFLAGWDEIIVVHDMLSTKFRNKSEFLVLPLHSMLPMFNQQAVFERPPVGVRKIVLATNIAETSITIDDIVYVINAGNRKEQMYDAAKKVSCLMTHWTSQASVVQRRGRAGRCKPGLCFNLFTREQFEHMAPYQSPEMQRVSLEEIVLQTKIQCADDSCKVQQFLSKALDPPSPFSVQSAVSQLQEIGALDDKEGLTALGRHMAYLPVEPRIAKMIIYGAIFRCLDPVLTIAAGLSYKDPFVSPLNCREQADQSRRNFAHDSRSDHVALLNAYNGWTEAMNHAQGKEFVQQRFLHWGTLNMIRGMRDQFSRLLEDSGLVPSSTSGDAVNFFCGNMELVKAILCAGLFPNAVKVGLGLESKGRGGKKRVRIAFRTKSDGRVALHPSSVNSDERQFISEWLVYHDKVKSTQVFIRDSSMVHPVALICFSGKDVREMHHGPAPPAQQPRVTLVVDGDRWMSFYCSPRLARILQAIRREINKMVACSISAASKNDTLFHYHTKLMEVVTLLLTLPVQQPLPTTG